MHPDGMSKRLARVVGEGVVPALVAVEARQLAVPQLQRVKVAQPRCALDVHGVAPEDIGHRAPEVDLTRFVPFVPEPELSRADDGATHPHTSEPL